MNKKTKQDQSTHSSSRNEKILPKILITVAVLLVTFVTSASYYTLTSYTPQAAAVSAEKLDYSIEVDLDDPKVIRDDESLLCVEDTIGGLRIHRFVDADTLADRTGIAMYLPEFEELHIFSEHDIYKGMKSKYLSECDPSLQTNNN